MDKNVPLFTKGIHNLLSSEKIPDDAAKDAIGFVTKDGKTVLVGGRSTLGADGAVGDVTGFEKGYKTDGSVILYRKIGTTIQAYISGTWTNIITGLVSTDEYVFQNYSSLAGAFTYVNGPTAFYKIINANPTSPINIYDSTKNFFGRILIDKGRMLLWNRKEDKTGLYGSKIDPQNSTVYTTVTNEAIGVLGSTNYTGTLAFKAGGTRRSCFGVSFDATVAAGTEVFTDTYLGTLTSNFGGTGTINYATGAYNITFSDTTTGAVTSDYQWEDSSVGGIADFTKSTPRQAAQGFVFPQDEGGDPIETVEVGIDGAYYSFKENSAYRLLISDDDATADNSVFRKDIGVPFFRAALSTGQGIIFMNTANPTKPEMTILRREVEANVVEPNVLFPQFKFSDYEYDDCALESYDRFVMVFCKSTGADNNDRILMCNIEGKTVDVVPYSGRMSVQDGEALYVGDSITQSVYNTFSGFDDLGLPITAHWDSKDNLFGTSDLKKTRRLRIKGFIDPGQVVKVYTNIDEGGFEWVGTIRGDGGYVNYSEIQTVGASMVGEVEVGGGTVTNVYGYFIELKLRTPKFRTLGIRLEPTGIGYFDFDLITYWDILLFEGRIPKIYRQKQDVSLDGTTTDN